MAPMLKRALSSLRLHAYGSQASTLCPAQSLTAPSACFSWDPRLGGLASATTCKHSSTQLRLMLSVQPIGLPSAHNKRPTCRICSTGFWAFLLNPVYMCATRRLSSRKCSQLCWLASSATCCLKAASRAAR